MEVRVEKKIRGDICVSINLIPENKFLSMVIRVTFHENKYRVNAINMADKQEFTRGTELGYYFSQRQDSHLHCK
jgi:hypothetical protein